jgi:hypothetical protein
MSGRFEVKTFLKIVLFLFVLSLIEISFADTPPPGTVKAKMFSGDGNTSFSATGTSLNTNITNSSIPVTGTFWQTTQPVSGTLTCNAGTGTQLVDGSAHTQPVSGTFWQATQPVSGTVAVSSLPALPSGSNTIGNVNINGTVPISGTITATNSANGATGSAVPAQATQVGGSDGTNLRALKVSSSGVLSVDGSASTQPISAASLPLPSGAATDAELITINSTLGSPFQAGGSIGNSSFGISGTLPAFASTPTFNLGTLNGAATAANQATQISSLATIATNTTNAGTPTVSGTVTANQGTAGASAWPVSAAQSGTWTATVTQGTGTNLHTVVDSSALPSGAATSANQSTEITSLSSIDGKTPALGQALAAGSVPVVLPAAQITTLTPLSSVTVTQGTGTNLHTVVDSGAITATISGTPNVAVTSSALPSGAATSAKQPALGVAGTPSSDVITVQGVTSMTALKVDGSAVTQPISAVSLPLPSGAATSANQSTEITSLSSIDGKTPALGQALAASSVPVVLTAAQLSTLTPLSSVTVTQATGTNLHTVVDSAPTTAVTQSGTWTVSNNPVAAASGSQTTGTVSTVITLTAPANAQGFILQNLGTSTANLRFAIGATATTTLGMQLAPGQDSGYVPAGANISLVAESSTQNYNVQWVVK